MGGKTVNIKREAAITPDLQGLDRHVIFKSRDLNVEMLCYNLYLPFSKVICNYILFGLKA